MVERLQHNMEEGPEKKDVGIIDPEIVQEAFMAVINENRDTSLRKPVSFERLKEVFEDAENEPHTLEELAAHLPRTKHPDRDIASLISRLNKAFERVGANIMVKHVTAYQIVERPRIQEDNMPNSSDGPESQK